MGLQVTIDESVRELAVGLVEATGLTIAAADGELVEYCRESVRRTVAEGPQGGDERRQAVRRLLRLGGFKPSGRSKPAQEYLLRVAQQEEQWPNILNAVDVLNVVSLRSGLPISMIAVGRLGSPLVIRYGLPGESFVFNQAGQLLDLEGLICICGPEGEHSIPFGTPVKDSQLAKVTAADAHVLACIFAPSSLLTPDGLLEWVNELASGLRKWCSVERVDARLLPPAW